MSSEGNGKGMIITRIHLGVRCLLFDVRYRSESPALNIGKQVMIRAALHNPYAVVAISLIVVILGDNLHLYGGGYLPGN